MGPRKPSSFKIDRKLFRWGLWILILVTVLSHQSLEKKTPEKDIHKTLGDGDHYVHGKSFEELSQWIRVAAQHIIRQATVAASDGVTKCFTPGGRGLYTAMWTRDLYFMVKGYPDGFSPEDLRNSVTYLLRAVRADGVAPDRVDVKGNAYYKPGPRDHPFAEPPTDNAQFLVGLVRDVVERTGDSSFFQEHAPTLEKTMKSIPRREDGLVFIDPELPDRSPFGFTDTVKKTGAVLFSSLLYREASEAMAAMYRLLGRREDASRWGKEARRLEKALDVFWDEEEGIFMAATGMSRQPDVWGSAYAVFSGAASEEQAEYIAEWLDTNFDLIVWRGMVRHLPEPEGWEGSLGDTVPLGRYQNGGYWPAATSWVAHAVRRVNPDRASQMILNLLRQFNRFAVFEWTHRNQFSGVGRNYVVSITMPLIAVREEERRRSKESL